MVTAVTVMTPYDVIGRRPASPANEVRHLLAVTRIAWDNELHNVTLAEFWPEIERAVVALNETDPRRRGDAIDRFVDAVERTVEATRKRLAACDAWTRDHDPE